MEDQSSFMSKWDSRFMELAIVARSWTKGLGAGVDRGVGACIVSPSRHQFSLGYAGFPRGIKDEAARLQEPEYRMYHTVHAELNAILNARCSVEGWTIYVTEAPCHDCSNAIVQAGIKRAVTGAPRRDSSWYRSQLEGRETMREAGLIVDTTEVRL
jgi:dCMP deaminase